MQRVLVSMMLVSSLLLSGCSLAYKIDIQQGNQVTPEMVEQLHTGMTTQQVRFVMGTPQVIHPYTNDRWDYLYRLEKDGQPTEQRSVTLYFEDERLVRIERHGLN